MAEKIQCGNCGYEYPSDIAMDEIFHMPCIKCKKLGFMKIVD